MKRSVLPFFIIIILFFSNCKTDFDVTAPYKEIAVVYGLLNASDTIQWVRINKAYLGEGNALVMAQQPDSINYRDILDVKLEEYDQDVMLRTIPLIRDSSIQKEPGIFAVAPNILYRTSVADKIQTLYKYKLVVYNRETKNTITSLSQVVDSIIIVYPQPSAEINWTSPTGQPVKWYTVPEGSAYQLTVRFHYDEENLSNPADIQSKYVDWLFPEKESTSGDYLDISIAGEDFYRIVAARVKPNTSVKRKAGKLDFIFLVAAKEFYTYVLVNHPPTGINQNIPQYSNVDGGVGIFSSRLQQTVKDKEMNSASKDSLVNGSITGNLGFYF